MRLQVSQRLSTLKLRIKLKDCDSTSEMISSGIYRWSIITVPRSYIWRRASPGTWTQRHLPSQPESGEGTVSLIHGLKQIFRY